MQAGKLRTKAYFLQVVEEQTALGETIQRYEVAFSRRVKLEPQAGKEFDGTNQEQYELPYKVRLRYDSQVAAVSTRMRLRVDNQVLRIITPLINPDQKRREVEFIALYKSVDNSDE